MPLHRARSSRAELESAHREYALLDRGVDLVAAEAHLRAVPGLEVARARMHAHPLAVDGIHVLEVAVFLDLELLPFRVPDLDPQGHVAGFADAAQAPGIAAGVADRVAGGD